jgi:hypothetical protein
MSDTIVRHPVAPWFFFFGWVVWTYDCGERKEGKNQRYEMGGMDGWSLSNAGFSSWKKGLESWMV